MAIRNFSLVVLDESDNIIDKYNLEYVTNISGLGYSLNVAKIETDVEDYITNLVQQKQNIKLKVLCLAGYVESNSLDKWIESHIDDTMALAYNDTTRDIYCECKVIQSDKTELNEYKILEKPITILPLTPFFSIVKNKVLIQVTSSGKSYPYKYPYNYGKSQIENNLIDNIYFKDIPLIVEIDGGISNPIVTLIGEDNEIYNEVRILNTTLIEGQRIIINGARKKIYYDSGDGKLVDYYANVDGKYDSYLRANPYENSKIHINLASTDSGKLIASWRQYTL